MSEQRNLKKTRKEYIKLQTISVSLITFLITSPVLVSTGATAWTNYKVEGRRGIPAFNNQTVLGHEGIQTIFHSDGRIEKNELAFTKDQKDYVSYQSRWQEVTEDEHYNVRSFTKSVELSDDLRTAINKNIYYEQFIEDPSTLENFFRNSEEEEQFRKVSNIEDYLEKEGVFSITSHTPTSDEEILVQARITSEQRASDLMLMGYISLIGLSIPMWLLLFYNDKLQAHLGRLSKTSRHEYKRAGRRLRELKRQEKR